jgi:hypothetical protein
VPRIDAYIEKALQLLGAPKADKKRVLLAFAESIAQGVRASIPQGVKCSGCGKTSALCGSCSVKQKVGQVALDALGFGSLGGLLDGDDGRQQPRDLGRIRGQPAPRGGRGR